MIGLDWELRDNIAVFENSSLILLIKLHLHQNGNLRAWIGQDKIMKATGLSRPTVTAAVNHLEKIGALVKVPGKFREDEEKGLPSRLTIYQLTGLFFYKDKPIHYLHFGTPEYEMTILTRVIAILEYQAEHTKDEAKRKECFTLKGKFLNHKDSFPKGITGTTLEGSTGKSTSGASAPVAHEGQSDGVKEDEDTIVYDYNTYLAGARAANAIPLTLSEFMRRRDAKNAKIKPPTPDAGKAPAANGATAEPVPEKKPRARNPIWDSLCAKVFELDPFTLDPKDTAAGRLKTLNGWCSRNNVTGEELTRFYVWYGEKYPDIALPRTATKFGEHFLKFRQAGSDAGKPILQRSTGAAT